MTVGSLFSGIGGLDLGLEWAGMETIWFCEIEDYPRQVLKRHWPNVHIYNDVREINASNAVRPDVIAGGFPCQPFSGAGKREGTEDDRHLWPEMLRIIQALRPSYVIGENVLGLTNWNNGRVFEQVLSDLEASDYTVFPPVVLPACAVGAPHKRDRVFVVAHDSRDRVPGPLSPTDIGFARPGWQGSEEDMLEVYRRPFTPGDRWPQPLLRRGHDGFTGWMDRTKALGNAVVPQVAYLVGRAVMEHAAQKQSTLYIAVTLRNVYNGCR